MKEPRGSLARYVYGYSDKKPGLWWWVIHAGMIAFILFHCVSCTPQAEDSEVAATGSQPKQDLGSFGIQVFRDPETGCEYLTYYGGGITPRYEESSRAYESMKVRGC